MSTIAENLLALQQVKTNIKTAIEGKGQDLTNVPFTEYAEKINLIGGADVSETDIQVYKYQDLTRVMSTGGVENRQLVEIRVHGKTLIPENNFTQT